MVLLSLSHPDCSLVACSFTVGIKTPEEEVSIFFNAVYPKLDLTKLDQLYITSFLKVCQSPGFTVSRPNEVTFRNKEEAE